VVPQNSSTGNYVVYWGAVTGITGYELEEDNRAGFVNPWRYTFPPTVTAVQLNSRPNGTWYYRIRAVNNGTFGNWLAGANGCVVLARGTLSLAVGPATPAWTRPLPGDKNVVVLQLALSVNSVENILVSGIQFHASGTLNDAVHVDAVTLYNDANRNGAVDAGTDTLLGGPVQFTTDDGTATFPGLGRNLSTSTQEYWLVALDLSPGAPVGATFQAAVRTNNDISVTGSVSGTGGPLVFGPLLQGGRLAVSSPATPPPPPTTVGSLRLSAAPSNPGHGEIRRGTAGNELLHLALEAGPEEPVRIANIVLTHFGTVSEPSGLITFTLHADANENGILDEEDRRISGPVPLMPLTTSVLFVGLNEVILDGEKAVWFVTAEIDKAVKIGSTLGVNVDCGHLWSVRGTTSLSSIPIEGVPLLGPEMTVVEGPPAPAPPRSGACGGSPSPFPSPDGVLGLALLLLAFFTTLRTAAQRR
jgi:hypothetical protein